MGVLARLLSLAIAAGYVVAAVLFEGGVSFYIVLLAAALLLPLALIWFSDALGGLANYLAVGGDTGAEDPPDMIAIIGWFLLVGLPLLLVGIHFLR